MATKQPPTITKKMLIPYIKKAYCDIQQELLKIKKKLGPRYNTRNRYVTTSERFGYPPDCPEKYFDEYILILNKKSKQPAAVRNVIDEIGMRAVRAFLKDREERRQKRQQKKLEKEQTEKE